MTHANYFIRRQCWVPWCGWRRLLQLAPCHPQLTVHKPPGLLTQGHCDVVAVHGSSPDRLDWPSSHSLAWPGDKKKQAILTPAAATTGAISPGLMESELMLQPQLSVGHTWLWEGLGIFPPSPVHCPLQNKYAHRTLRNICLPQDKPNLSQLYYSLPLLW